MKFIRGNRLLLLIILLLVGGCAQTIHLEPVPYIGARIVERGVIECFEAGLTTSIGNSVQCETSAVVYTGHEVIMGSDKPIPGDSRSAVFSLRYDGTSFDNNTLTYLTAPPFKNAVKYEDFTLTPDGKYIIAATGFDRVKTASSEWDVYNTLLMWPVDHPEHVTIVSPTTRDGITSSVLVRQQLSAALKTNRFLDEMPYFKVEGLAAIPGGMLLFGIREWGKRYDDFDYAVIIIAVSYKIEDETLMLGDDFRVIYDYNPATHPSVARTVALSSLEYDRYGDRLYLLTSFEEAETDEGLGGFLWILPIASLTTQCAPTLVMQDASFPLLFAHKAEGVTILDSYRVLVIHDDDRVVGRQHVENSETQFFRQANQAAYTIVELSH